MTPSQPSSASQASPEGSRRRILYAEDDPAVAEVVALFLRRSGYEVDAVSDGAQALHRLLRVPHGYALLLTDNEMPVLSGLDLLKRLRSEGVAVQVAVFSASVGSNLGQFKELGVVHCLSKPARLATLLELVRSALSHEP